MRAPVLAIGDGALGFWGALREVFPQARAQRCWLHKIANVLGALPKSAHPGAKKALTEIWNAEDKTHALAAVKAFEATYGARFDRAVFKITDDLEELLAFYDYPAEHWVHLRTTNPIESTFETVRHRTKVTRGPGSRAAGLLPSTDFADDGVVHDAHAWSRASSSCWRPDRHTAGWRRQRTSGNAGGGRCCRAASAPRRPGRLRCGSACPRHPGSSMKWVGLVGELVTPRGQSRGRKLPSGRRHRERRGRLRWECRSTLGSPWPSSSSKPPKCAGAR